MYRRSLDAKPTCGVHARPSSDVFSKCKKPHFLIRESCMQMAFAHLGMRYARTASSDFFTKQFKAVENSS